MLALGAGMASAQSQPGNQAPAGNDQAQQPQRTIQMVRAQASLDTTLDAKKAKQGEAVKAKLQANVQIPNEEMLPKNTVLEGHVDQVQPSEHKSDSTVVVTFDKALLKGGKELPIKATILEVSEPALMQEAAGGAPAAPGAAGGAPMASPQAGGGGAAGGGAGASSPSAPSAPSQMDVPEANANQQKQAGGVPGVMLTSDIHQHTSATFTSKGRNVHVPGGTEMQLALTVIPAGVKMQ
jgi:hypothetical protein